MPQIDTGAGNGNGISGFKTSPLTDSNDSICSRTDTQYHQNRIDETQLGEYLDMKPKNVGTLEEYFVRGVQ